MNENVIVSVIIPTYNRSSLLLESLRSVEQQSLHNLECIIIDDGSIDNTEDIVNSFIEKDSRFKYFKRSEEYAKGACGSRNMGFDKSIGKYIQYLDDDDLLSRNKLELQVNNLEGQKSKNVFTTCDWDVYWENKEFEPKSIFNNQEKILADEYLDKLAENETFIPYHTFLIPSKVVKNAGPWNIDLTINDDAEFILRILLYSDGLINTEDCYVLYRTHNDNRLSAAYTNGSLHSILRSYDIMNSNLSSRSLKSRKFFKWRLGRILLAFGRTDKLIFQSYKSLFAQYGIYLSLTKFYFFKAYIYKMIYPIVKKMRVNIKN
jgi:glycosyltransferase involved in cell wall biosynthesis